MQTFANSIIFSCIGEDLLYGGSHWLLILIRDRALFTREYSLKVMSGPKGPRAFRSAILEVSI